MCGKKKQKNTHNKLKMGEHWKQSCHELVEKCSLCCEISDLLISDSANLNPWDIWHEEKSTEDTKKNILFFMFSFRFFALLLLLFSRTRNHTRTNALLILLFHPLFCVCAFASVYFSIATSNFRLSSFLRRCFEAKKKDTHLIMYSSKHFN